MSSSGCLIFDDDVLEQGNICDRCRETDAKPCNSIHGCVVVCKNCYFNYFKDIVTPLCSEMTIKLKYDDKIVVPEYSKRQENMMKCIKGQKEIWKAYFDMKNKKSIF